MKVNVLFFIIFLILGLILLILSIILKVQSNKKIKRCINTVKGKIIKYTLWNNNGVHIPVVEYVVNGVSYTQKFKYGWIITKSSSFHNIVSEVKNDIKDENLVISKNSHISTNTLNKHFPIGKELDVYYAPENPKISYVMRFVKNPCIAVFLFIGIFFVVLALIGLLLMPNNMISNSSKNDNDKNEQIWVTDCYKYDSNGEIKKYLCDEDMVIIPSEINETEIVSIDSNAFDSGNIKGVTIPSTISDIKKYAFVSPFLENVLIEGDNVTVHYDAFSFGSNLEEMNIYYVGSLDFVKTGSTCSEQDEKLVCFNASNYKVVLDMQKVSEITYKNVKMMPLIKDDIVYGKSIDKFVLNNDEMMIKGYKEIIDLVDYISVTVDEENISESKTYDISFENIFGSSYVNSEGITATLSLDDTNSKEYILNNIEIIGLDLNYNVNIEQNEFKVLVKGTKNNLSKLSKEDIKLYIDLTGYQEGSYDISVKTEIDNNLLLGVFVDNYVNVEIIKK